MSFSVCNRRLERLLGACFGSARTCSAGCDVRAPGRSNDLNAIAGGRLRLVALRDVAAFINPQTTAGTRPV